MAILALLPIGVFLFLLLILRRSSWWSAVIALVVSAGLMAGYWKVLPFYWWTAVVKAGFMALDIGIIIVGAVFFLEVVEKKKIMETMGYFLGMVSGDYRVQVIMLAWFLEAFIEGTAGFGTPSTVVAPILLGLGLNPITAVVLSLLGNSTAVAFGAAGTPIRVGLAGLGVDFDGVGWWGAMFNVVGLIVPIFMLWVIVRARNKPMSHFWQGLPFAIWSGAVYVACSLATMVMGQEFPSIVGAIIAGVIVLVTMRWGWFLPKDKEKFETHREVSREEIWGALWPYLGLIAFLLVGKFVLGSVVINLPGGIKQNFNLFNPGWAFLLMGIIVSIVWRMGLAWGGKAVKVALVKTINPFGVILAMSVMIQLMLHSGFNSSGLPSAVEVLASGLHKWLLPMLAPVLGSFGSFVTGSATLSNVMFGGLIVGAGEMVSVNVLSLLGLLLAGGAAGNMVALADMLVAETTVGLKNKEREVLKEMWWPCAIYVLLLAVVGGLVLWF